MDLKVTDDQLKSIIAGAVMTAISEEQRKELVQSAIKSLLEPQEPYDRYSNQKRHSKIYEAFVNAANSVARECIEKLFEYDENIKKEISKMVEEAFVKAFTGDARQKMIDGMSNGLYSAFTEK